jgi:subtilisin-like proprotein convertase family protein
VLDDDEVAKQAETKVIRDEKNPSLTTTLSPTGVHSVMSSNKLAATLNALGYVATVEPSATSNAATWPGYSFIVSASGANTGPVANAAYRAALEAYVAAGHKILVEGGEVGYDAISSPGYPTFAANVLHGGAWSTDNAGALLRVAAQATHPLATTPNFLPPSIGITYGDYGSEDSYSLTGTAVAIYGTTTQNGNAGISAFDDNQAPQAGQIVVFAFDFKDVTDSTTAVHLLENAAHWLLAPEPGAHSSLTGRVALGTSWGGGGIAITLLPGTRTTTTAADGTFRFDSLYAGNYSVSAAASGYAGTPRNVVLTQDAETNVVLRLFTAASANACTSPALAIPDNNATGITSTATVGPSFAITALECSVDITHTWKGDLIVELRHGATNVRLHNRTGGSTDNIIGTYPTTITPAASLSAFTGQLSDGAWSLFVSDNASSDVGTLNQWCVVLHGASDTTQTVGVGAEAPPLSVEFAPVWPNPTRSGAVSMSFALPASARARVALYDIGGRLVRTVADRVFQAGRTALVWDGNDERGVALRPGLYLARFTSGANTLNRRVVVLP